jgi:hypothetical protein
MGEEERLRRIVGVYSRYCARLRSVAREATGLLPPALGLQFQVRMDELDAEALAGVPEDAQEDPRLEVEVLYRPDASIRYKLLVASPDLPPGTYRAVARIRREG